MSISLGTSLKIRSMIHMAAEPIPYFWPMRTFIHHNPLHGLEHLPFPEAVQEGMALFHGRGYLPRPMYQQYLAEGKVDRPALETEVEHFLSQRPDIPGIHLSACLIRLLHTIEKPVYLKNTLATAQDVYHLVQGEKLRDTDSISIEQIAETMRSRLQGDRPVYEAVDELYGTDIGVELDDMLIKSCLDFFDEGQAVWSMPGRAKGFFASWRDIASRNLPLFLRGIQIKRILSEAETPEGIIAYVLNELRIPEERWMDYFTRELSRLHGWVGFIRWRSSAKRYYWNQQHPGDLIDFMAIRLTLALAALNSRKLRHLPTTRQAIREAIDSRTMETFLRYELHGKRIMPVMAATVEQALEHGDVTEIRRMYTEYVRHKRHHEAKDQLKRLQNVMQISAQPEALQALSVDQLHALLQLLADFEQQEGMIWLRAMEAQAMQQLLHHVRIQPESGTERRPFAQALFCIDTRSERIRRHLESVGNYQTFGIAGFFGVPVSFMELGKGSEMHLCPVILTPQNLVLEVTANELDSDHLMTVLDKALHDLKASVLAPFVTVEAIGLLFGFDMIGKTLAPHTYHQWRKQLHAQPPQTHLLVDKLSRVQADSILRAVQRAIIARAIEQEYGLPAERVTDDMIRELRESALENHSGLNQCMAKLALGKAELQAFVERLKTLYRINPSAVQVQLERLGRIGFTLDEQVNYVSQALSAIGLKQNFSRFVLLVGHGSRSENNPYESALDCGACGGNHGDVSGKVLAQMANKPEVRRRLKQQGIEIPDDTWFLPAFHNTTTDQVELLCLERIPPTHLLYLDRLRNGLTSASRLCAQERIPTLARETNTSTELDPATAFRHAQRNAVDWSQVRPEWGLSGNAYFIIGRRHLTQETSLEGRSFLHSYDYRVDPKQRLLENIITGPLVVGQWINMEHYFSTVDNQRFGSGSKVNHNVAGRFGVMTGNVSDLRTGLPAQTVLKDGRPYHQPIRLITVIEAPFKKAKRTVESVVTVKNLVSKAWIRLLIIDPETGEVFLFDHGQWHKHHQLNSPKSATLEDTIHE